MKKLLIVIVLMALVLVGCTQHVAPTTPPDTTGSGSVDTAPSQQPTETPTTPSIPELDSTEGNEPTTPTEPSESSQKPYQTTAEEIAKIMDGKFSFGDSVLYKPAYVHYPEQDIVEMQFMYNGTRFYARARFGAEDIACWQYDWLKPYSTSYELEGLHGDIRRAKVDDVVHTSIIWYDEARNLTLTLDWQGPGESYLDVAAVAFNFVEESEIVIPLT